MPPRGEIHRGGDRVNIINPRDRRSDERPYYRDSNAKGILIWILGFIMGAATIMFWNGVLPS